MSTPHLSVCICTFERPELLRKLLSRLVDQKTDQAFTYSAVVVDNDANRSAESTVSELAAGGLLKIVYCVEPEPNIARARNLAIKSSSGDYIVFIDDDEFPESDWLQNLLAARIRYNASGVLAPVRPYFENDPPKWLKDGKFFDRPEHETGFVLDWNECRTGNVLFAKSILEGDDAPFDVKFNTAGEDVDFFRRMVQKGCVFVWSQEAVVHEVVPASRCNRRYLLKRALLRGSNFSKHPTHRLANAARSLVAVPCYTIALPIFAVFGQHVFLKYLIKLLDHASRLLSYIGLPVVSERHT